MLTFRELHKSTDKELLNEEWLLIENTGPNPVSAAGCALTVARRVQDRARPLGTLDPGFVLQPKEKIRLVTGTPSKKTHGTPPDDKDVKNYHLFLKEPILSGPGIVLRLALKQMELAKAVYAPDKKDGLAEG